MTDTEAQRAITTGIILSPHFPFYDLYHSLTHVRTRDGTGTVGGLSI